MPTKKRIVCAGRIYTYHPEIWDEEDIDSHGLLTEHNTTNLYIGGNHDCPYNALQEGTAKDHAVNGKSIATLAGVNSPYRGDNRKDKNITVLPAPHLHHWLYETATGTGYSQQHLFNASGSLTYSGGTTMYMYSNATWAPNSAGATPTFIGFYQAHTLSPGALCTSGGDNEII